MTYISREAYNENLSALILRLPRICRDRIEGSDGVCVCRHVHEPILCILHTWVAAQGEVPRWRVRGTALATSQDHNQDAKETWGYDTSFIRWSIHEAVAVLVVVLVGYSATFAQTTNLVTDLVGDAQIRRMDPGADGPVDTVTHLPPDVVSYEIGAWQPIDPHDNEFEGAWDVTGDFFRLDVIFDGLVNPPGTLGLTFPFDPFLYGPNPVFGYIEIDMDADVGTGGELDSPELRYLGNAGRYGGLPSQTWFAGRAALDASAFDGVLATPPEVDRSGEEFHLAFHGWEIKKIKVKSGDLDALFEAGETWKIEGELFHRAHGFEPFSYACCSGSSGSYEPEVNVRFSHSISSNQTTVSLVYALTNAGSAALIPDPIVEPNDGDSSNQNSVLEALDDLWFSASNPCCGWTSDPDWAIISGWSAKDPNLHLDPLAWRVNIQVATSYTAQDPSGTLFVWSDLTDDIVSGDFDASGVLDALDVGLFDVFVSANDGLAGVDEDGSVNGVVDLINFGPNFSVYDTDYDGLVNALDRPVPQYPGDFDSDGDVDVRDFLTFSNCFNGALHPPAPACQNTAADLDGDGDVDPSDFLTFSNCYNGALNTPSCP